VENIIAIKGLNEYCSAAISRSRYRIKVKSVSICINRIKVNKSIGRVSNNIYCMIRNGATIAESVIVPVIYTVAWDIAGSNIKRNMIWSRSFFIILVLKVY
jgi:hypothetical protein